MDNLIFCLNATVPVFLMMLLGLLFRKLGWISEAFAAAGRDVDCAINGHRALAFNA